MTFWLKYSGKVLEILVEDGSVREQYVVKIVDWFDGSGDSWTRCQGLLPAVLLRYAVSCDYAVGVCVYFLECTFSRFQKMGLLF